MTTFLLPSCTVLSGVSAAGGEETLSGAGLCRVCITSDRVAALDNIVDCLFDLNAVRGRRGHSNMHGGIVLGLLTTVLVLDPQKLVCRVVFGSYPHG